MELTNIPNATFSQALGAVPRVKDQLIKKQLQIASQVVDLLGRRNWKQRDLARKAELKDSYISRVLAGDANLTLESIAKLEVAFDEEFVVIKKFYTSTVTNGVTYRPDSNPDKVMVNYQILRPYEQAA